jgi:methionyl-tRNA formyltransferase
LRAVVSAPPRPAGRNLRPQPAPAARVASERGLPVLTPERLRDPAALEAIRGVEPDLIVVADYGRLIPAAVLDLPAQGALNLHPSLLPRWRGASPVAAAILAGDRETGVTLMRMDEGLDTGPIVAQRTVTLTGRETTPDLEGQLASIAADLLRTSLGAWLRGQLSERAQDPTSATMTRPLRREDGWIDPGRPAAELERQVRAYQPWPGSFVEVDAGRLIVWAAEVGADPDGQGSGVAPGTILADGEGIALATFRGRLRLLEVQPAGGRRMRGADLRRGRPKLVGSTVAGPKRPPTVA